MKKVLVIAVALLALGALIAEIYIHRGKTVTAKVSRHQLMTMRGFDLAHGNKIVGIRLVRNASTSGGGLVILGSGHVDINSKNEIDLLVNYQLADGSVYSLTVKVEDSLKRRIVNGPSMILWHMKKPFKEAYNRKVSDPILKAYTDDNDYHIMGPSELVQHFVDSVVLALNAKTFNRLFGGVS